MIPASWRAWINFEIAKISSGKKFLLGCCVSVFIVNPPFTLPYTSIYKLEEGSPRKLNKNRVFLGK